MKRLWLCPVCGHTWKNDPRIPEEKRPYPVWPTHYLEATQDNCDGKPVSGVWYPDPENRVVNVPCYPPEIQDRIDYGRYLRGQDDAS